MPCLNGNPNLTSTLSAFECLTSLDSHSQARLWEAGFQDEPRDPNFLLLVFYLTPPLDCGLDLQTSL